MSKGKPNVFIIESLDLEDEKDELFEGRILSQVLHLGAKESFYYYIRTRSELKRILGEFDRTGFRYLHFSCHGNKASLSTTLDDLPFTDFGTILKPHLDGKRLFISACSAVNDTLAMEVIPGSGCYSVIGPSKKIRFNDSAIVWATFYHLIFRENPKGMKREYVSTALRKIREIFGVSLEYYATSDNRRGFEKVNFRRLK